LYISRLTPSSRRYPANKIAAPSLDSDSDDEPLQPERPYEAAQVRQDLGDFQIDTRGTNHALFSPSTGNTLFASASSSPGLSRSTVARSPNPSFLSPQYQGSDSATKRNISSLEDSASKTTPNGKSFSVPASPSGRSGQKNRSRVEDEVDLVFREMESSRRQSVERAVEEQVAFLAQREREMRNRTQELIQQREAESAAREEQAAEENARVQVENDRALELRL
jgi:hypothetical protein